MDHSFLSALILLLLVLDPLGGLPIYIPIMNSVPKERRRRVALREASIAFAVLLGFMFAGEAFLRVMHLSERSLEAAGGKVADFSGGDNYLFGKEIVAGNAHVFQELQETVKRFMATPPPPEGGI